ncbi:MAG TPA: HEAT repeat domain-containing protein [Ktedonobacterales bacterium]|nr:HEAT repeat domain-containing protein [Ktedonobacterales bacterium]
MAEKRGEGARRKRRDPLSDARLCADESYYQALARPLVRQGAARRLRDTAARFAPLLAAACALFVSLSLTLTRPALPTDNSPLAPLVARFAGASPGMALALDIALPLLVALVILSLWARRDRSISLRAEAALVRKTRQARAYRQYLTALAWLTEPLAWTHPASAATAADAPDAAEAARPPAVLVALTLRREPLPEADELAVMADDSVALGPDTSTRVLTATRPLTRSGLDSSLDAIRDALHPAQPVENVAQALASAPSGAIILSGPEGAGKTTLMRYVAHAQALAQLNRAQPGGRLPFYADLAWLDAAAWPSPAADAVEVALATLVERIGGVAPADARDLAQALISEPALLLLDELDTLPSDQRERVAESLAAFLAERPRIPAGRESAGGWNAQVVLGARSYDGPLGDGGPRVRFEPWRLEPLAYPLGRLALVRGALAQRSASSRAATETTAQTEATASDASDAEMATRLLQELRQPQTERWLMQPLALTLAALGAAGATEQSEAPLSQSDLHRAAVRRLLGARLPDWSEAERQALLRLAEETALWLQRAGRRAFIPATPELDQHLREAPEAMVVAGRAGDESPSRVIATQSGLCERGAGDLVSFSLVTLHAFLAGSALARHVAAELPPTLLPDATPSDALRALDALEQFEAPPTGALLPKPLTPDALPSQTAPTLAAPISASDGQTRWLDLAWANRASASWGDTLLFLCGALCAPIPNAAGAETPRSDIAVAWLRALLDQREYVEPSEALATLGLLLAASSLPELRGDPAGGRVAAEIAYRLCEALRQSGEATSPVALARLYQACGAALADPTARAALLHLLTEQLLGANERAARQAAQALGGFARVGATVAPLLIDLLGASTGATRAAVAQGIGALGPIAGAEAVPELVEALADHSRAVRTAAVEALGEIVTEPTTATLAAVMALLTDRAGEARAAAALALGKMGAAGHLPQIDGADKASADASDDEASGIPRVVGAARISVGQIASALRLALRDHETRVAVAAAYALGLVDTTGGQAPILIEGLSARWNDRAALALGALGAAALPTLPTLLELTRAESPILRESATRAVAQIGPQRADVVAALVARLSDEAPECRRAAADALTQMDPAAEGIAKLAWPALIELMGDPRESVRWSAGRALEALGATDDPASLAALFALLDDPRGYIRANAARTLEAVAGPQARATPDRVARLASVRDETCVVAIGALGALGSSARLALPALARLAGDPRWDIRRAALRSMRQIDPHDDRTISRSIIHASDPEALVRLEALEALGGQKSRHDRLTLEALQRRLRSESEGAVRAAASQALGRMGPRAAGALPLLARALLDSDSEARRAAALAIGALQPDLARVTPLLIDALAETEPGPRSASALAMGALGPRAAASLTQELLTLLRDEYAMTRAAAAEALGHYGSQVEGPAPAILLQRLTDRDAEVRAAAAYALGQIGAQPAAGGYDAEELEAALVERADDQRYVVRRAAVAALTALGPGVVARALSQILETLTDLNPGARDAALDALATLDATGRAQALATLSAWLGDTSADRRAVAARALARLRTALDPADRDALSLLLTDADDATRAAAASAVGALSATSFTDGPPPALGQLLGDTAWKTRAAAAEALGRFGAQTSVDDRRALREALADRDESIRLAATHALAQVEPEGVAALIAELLTMIRTRRPTGAFSALTARAEGDVYAAMTRPTWTTVERVSGWLTAADTAAELRFDAISLLGRWRYAPMEARRALLRLRDRTRYPMIRLAAHAALQSILVEVADFDAPGAQVDARLLLLAGAAHNADDTLASLREASLRPAPVASPAEPPDETLAELSEMPAAELLMDDYVDADEVDTLTLEAASGALEPPLQGAKSFTTYALIDETGANGAGARDDEPLPTVKLPDGRRGSNGARPALPPPPPAPQWAPASGLSSGDFTDAPQEPTTRLDAAARAAHNGAASPAPRPAPPPASRTEPDERPDMLSGDLSGFLIGGLPDDLAATTRKFATAHGLTLHDDPGATAPITVPAPAPQPPEPAPPATQDEDDAPDTQDAPPQVAS